MSWVHTPFFAEVLPQKNRDLTIAFPQLRACGTLREALDAPAASNFGSQGTMETRFAAGSAAVLVLQPCISPGTISLHAPLEAQGRGFAHGHGKVLLSLREPPAQCDTRG
jgi:hypothetical protein